MAQTFPSYYEETWLGTQEKIEMANVFDREIRTNNATEGWNNKVSRYINIAHPNVYQVIKFFKDEESQSKTKLLQLEQGNNPPKRRKQYVDKDKQITEIKRSYISGQISDSEFLERISLVAGLAIL